ncbi:MAG: type II toxin-antitoxin system HicB family antitoxin [Pyrinomonadaceae bacterium]
MANLKYPFVTYPSPDGGYVAEIPALKGCLAQGETLDETLRELEIVEDLWLESAKKNRVRLPKLKIEINRVIERLAA